MAANVQTLRFRRPEPKAPVPTVKPKNRHGGLLQDQLRRAQRAPWCPSFSTALRAFLLVRVAGAMYSNIQDCDEVFNFWEPLHYLDRGYGFQTWETSPIYALRSWTYIILHLIPAQIAKYAIGGEKRPAFFAVRITLAFISSFCEAYFYRAVLEKINYRVGRYLFFMLLFSAGMWSASTALLPSSFAMYANTFGMALAMEPPSSSNFKRTLYATLSFAVGAIVGWPFALAVAIPFVLEELFVYGADRVPPETKGSWMLQRWKRLFVCGAVAALLFIPSTAIDTLFYGKLTLVPWNIVKYNVFPDPQRGPGLYGTEPASWYLSNLLLKFNVAIPLAILSLPALALTHRINLKRLGERTPGPDQSSPYLLLALRLAPAYLWMQIMTAQAHKEERFMYPIYPLICFNAAVALYLMRASLETAFIAVTKSPYRASISSLFSRFTLSVVSAFMVLSVSHIFTQWKYYHAPLSVTYALEWQEIPRLLNTTGHIYLPPADILAKMEEEERQPRIDRALVKPFNLRLCVGKEWHRFPGHYLVPDYVHVNWIKNEFDGMLPGHFKETPIHGGLLERVHGTRSIPSGLNDLNKEAPELYVDVSECDYLLDLDFPLHPVSSALEPRYAADKDTWARVECKPFLDAQNSWILSRTLWMPGETWQQGNEYGELCLLKHRENVARKEKTMTIHRGV